MEPRRSTAIPNREASASWWRKILLLQKRDLYLLLGVAPTLLLVRIALWLMPSTRLHSLLVRFVPARGRHSSGVAVERLSWAVATVARIVPRATCLTQALTLQSLLRARGERSEVQIGFLKEASGKVRGHAWLMWQGRPVIGGATSDAFTPFASLKG